MFRVLLIPGLVCTGNVLAAESDEIVERYRAYFESLDLSYVEPRGCSDDAPCSVTEDFNDDGVPDLAALYQYSGDNSRRNRWNLDLVIVYSQGASSEPTHMVFTHVGQVDAERGAAASLAIQEKGSMKIPSGEITLDRPGINIVSAGNTGADEYPTFYWRGETFYAIDKSDD
ncbi:MAG: hypothetical protein O7B25_05085 [Gammaproteobacteria bacterium]|nr:hypothetical protein [Gammaproteobacteria bacterium]